MNVNLGDADGATGIALSVFTDYLRELTRLGRLPSRLEFDRDVGGQAVHVIVLFDPYTFEMVTVGPDAPRTRLRLLGIIEVRPANDPNAPPTTFPLDAAVKLAIALFPTQTVAEVGFRYDGVDGSPAFPVAAADIDTFMQGPLIQQVINNTRLPLAEAMVEGLNESRFPLEAFRPEESEWSVQLTLTPAGSDSVDAFVVSAGPPGTTAVLGITESFILPRTGLGVAFGRDFLDLVLERGAEATVGTEVQGAVVTALTMSMADTGIRIDGHVVREIDTPVIDIAPDVDIDIDGIAIPRLVRGTTALTMDNSGLDVDVDDSDEIFYGALKWVLTVGASALLFTGVGSLAALGIGLWVTLVQFAWNGAAQLDNAPNIIRNSLGAILGAKLSKLAESLDDSTELGELRVDGTPDSALVVDGNLVLLAQVIIVTIQARLRSAEYSKKLRKFTIFELDDRRKFRAQELARLMQAGKITVSGFHHVRGKYVRSDHDNSAANNLLQSFKDNETPEVVVNNK